jgi:hypothetical protein
MQLADTAVACASHFRETGGQGLPAIIDYEHRGVSVRATRHLPAEGDMNAICSRPSGTSLTQHDPAEPFTPRAR